MKNTTFIVLLVICISYSFIKNNKTLNLKEQKKECFREFKQDVKKYWHYDKKGKYYVANDTFLRKLNAKYYTCLKGMDTISFFKLFGKPNNGRTKGFPTIGFSYTFQQGIYGYGIVELIIILDKDGKLANRNTIQERNEDRIIQ